MQRNCDYSSLGLIVGSTFGYDDVNDDAWAESCLEFQISERSDASSVHG